MNKINILGIEVDKVDLVEARNIIFNYIDRDKYGHLIVTPNPEIIMKAKSDPELTQIINQADLRVADGIGLVLAARILRKPLAGRVAGFDLMQELLKKAAVNKNRVYFLGGKPGVAQIAASRAKNQYPGLNICGCHHGFLEKGEQYLVISEINKIKPDILFVGMGVPLQEKFLARYLKVLKVNVAMTVGGSFDVMAGIKKRAPDWLQRCHLEWFYRLLQEPSRWKRILVLPLFVLNVLAASFTDK